MYFFLFTVRIIFIGVEIISATSLLPCAAVWVSVNKYVKAGGKLYFTFYTDILKAGRLSALVVLTFHKAVRLAWALQCCATFVFRKGFAVADLIKYCLHQEMNV